MLISDDLDGFSIQFLESLELIHDSVELELDALVDASIDVV